MAGVEDDRRQVVLDYFQPDASWNLEQAMATLSDLETDQLLDPEVVAESLHLSGGTTDPDGSLQPRGYRMLSRVPRLPSEIAYRLVDHFHTLDKLMRATVDDLAAVDGVGDTWAVTIKDALSHIAEAAILDRYN
jgi:diadenylate cyclase